MNSPHDIFNLKNSNDIENVKLNIVIDGQEFPATVHSFSPFGLEFIYSKYLEKGTKLDAKIRIGKSSTNFKALSVEDATESEKGAFLHSIRTFKPSIANGTEDEKRTAHRWFCSKENLPTGVSPNPLKYNDYIFFRILDVSSNGLQIITSLRNKYFLEGQRLDSTITLPYVGSIQVVMEIKRFDVVNDDGQDMLSVGVRLVNPDEIALESLAEYLLNFGENVSVNYLKKQGFKVRKTSKLLDFTYCKSEIDYEKTLVLRCNAYKAVKKIPEETQPKDMADKFDACSRILIAKHDDQIVSTMRLVWPSSKENSYYLRFFDMPKNWPNINECIECTSGAVDENYRGDDVFAETMAHITLSAIKSGRKYLLLGCSGFMIDVYESFGFKKNGISYSNPKFPNLRSEMMLLDVAAAIVGKHGSMKKWNSVYSPLFEYVRENELFEVSSFDLLRAKALGLIKGLFS